MTQFTAQGPGFLADGKPFTPIGFNASVESINRMGADAFMARCAANGVNVVRIILTPPIYSDATGTIVPWFSEWLKIAGDAATRNGVSLLPSLIFPTFATWAQDFAGIIRNPFSLHYPTVDIFYQKGIDDFIRYINAMAELFQALSAPIFAIELVNELQVGPLVTIYVVGLADRVQVDAYQRLSFIYKALGEAKKWPYLTTFSRPYPYGLDTENEIAASVGCDFIAFHTYGADALEWHVMLQKDLWKRMFHRLMNVARVCAAVRAVAQGKPFLDTEMPIIPVMNPISDFFARIFRRPQMADFDSHFFDVGSEYMQNGAAGPGMQWGCCSTDITDGQLAQLKRLADGNAEDKAPNKSGCRKHS